MQPPTLPQPMLTCISHTSPESILKFPGHAACCLMYTRIHAPRLSRQDPVSEVASIGGFVKQYQVDIDPVKLRAYNVSTSDVVSAIQRSNSEVGGKIIESSSAEYFIRGQGYIKSIGDIENTVVSNSSGIPVLIKNIGTVQLGGDIRRGSLEKNGKGEAVGGIVVMRNGQNASEVIDRIKEEIKEITPGLPEGVTIVPSYDRSILIKEAVGTLERDRK